MKTQYFDQITCPKSKYGSNAAIHLFMYHTTRSYQLWLFRRLIERIKSSAKLLNQEHTENELST